MFEPLFLCLNFDDMCYRDLILFVLREKIDVHLNVLRVGEPGGRYHSHTVSDNVYIVKSGEGSLVHEGVMYAIKRDDVIYIPAGHKHSLTNSGADPLELFEIYTPAGKNFDFVLEEEN